MRPRARRPATPRDAALRLPTTSERLTALRRERDRLLAKVATQQQKIAAIADANREVETAIFWKIPALIEQMHALADELRASFTELLQPGRLKYEEQRAVLEVYQALREGGLLDTRDDARPQSFRKGRHAPSDAETGAESSPPRGGGFSAQHAGGDADKGSVREVFRRLALALHPDRTQHADEKLRRTEAMKALTRAYEEGDLARLLAVEQSWLQTAEARAGTDDARDQLASLERVVADLSRQLKELTHELRELRRSSPERAFERKRGKQRAGASLDIQQLMADAERDLALLTSVRSLVVAFRDGKLDLPAFLSGLSALER